MRTSQLCLGSFVLALTAAPLGGCIFEGDSQTTRPVAAIAPPVAEPASCDSAPSPQIIALDMPPSAKLGSGDYAVTGHVRYTGCSVVTIKVHVYSPESDLRVAPALAPSSSGDLLSVHFPASRQGENGTYDVSVVDARGRESTTLRETVILE